MKSRPSLNNLWLHYRGALFFALESRHIHSSIELFQTWRLKNPPIRNQRDRPIENRRPQQNGECGVYCAPDAEKCYTEHLVQCDGQDCVHTL